MKQKFIDYFMGVAEQTATLSYATRLQVGCVIVKDNRILSIGYNGTPSGWDNCCEDEEFTTKPEVLHAEQNAILKLCISHDSSKNAILFITHSPCLACAKLIHGAEIAKVYYKNEYRSQEGIQFLKKCGIEVIRI